MADRLRALGYQDGESLHVHTYDWRKNLEPTEVSDLGQAGLPTSRAGWWKWRR